MTRESRPDIQPQRIESLNKKPSRPGRYVLYWMQQAQRVPCNHALEYAIEEGNRQQMPVVVYFGLTPDFPRANARHFTFMLEGLQEVQKQLRRRRIKMVIRPGAPDRGVADMAAGAALVIVDRGYLRVQKKWRRAAAQKVPCRMVQVETDVIVPVETASDREEYSAATLRRKLSPLLPGYLVPLSPRRAQKSSLNLPLKGMEIKDIPTVLRQMKIPVTANPLTRYRGGTRAARRWLATFIKNRLEIYPALKNDPSMDCLSQLSPYLHFGQISPLEVALKITAAASPGRETFLEELFVRRELSMNFVHYNSRYDRPEALPAWARKTLGVHAADPRPYRYTLGQLERARTHDPYWNAAQQEMVLAGKMHGYMRMYWGKKILEWSSTPRRAQQVMIRLNDTYSLDGRDPNSYAGIAWCLGKHDRPWQERPVFGMVRYMNHLGLERKFNMQEYVNRVESLGDMRGGSMYSPGVKFEVGNGK